MLERIQKSIDLLGDGPRPYQPKLTLMTVVVRLALDGIELGRNSLDEDMLFDVLTEEAASDPDHLHMNGGQDDDEEESDEKKKKKKKFKNCAAVHIGKRCLKIFTNGKLHITGVHSPSEVDEALQLARDVVARCLSVSSRTITSVSTNIMLISMNMYLPDVALDETKLHTLFNNNASTLGLHRAYVHSQKKFLCAVFDSVHTSEASKKPNCRIHKTGNITFSAKSTDSMASMFHAVLLVLKEMDLTVLPSSTSKKRKQQIPLIEVAIEAGMAHNHLPCREHRPDCPYCRTCGNVMMLSSMHE